MTFSLAPDVSVTRTDTGMVLLDERSGRYWELNRSGAQVLEALLDGGGAQRATEVLRERYGQVERIGADVDAVIDALRTAGIVVA